MNQPINRASASRSAWFQSIPGTGAGGGSAFTLIELLAVIATLALLAMMILPALASTRTNTQAFQCLSNLKRLQMGWLAYSGDNNDTICPTAGILRPPTTPQWVFGGMHAGGGEQTNITLIKQGLLWPYVKSIQIYKCPADPKKALTGQPTVRSISMNCWMNPANAFDNLGRAFRKQTEISGPITPAGCWVVIDEAPDSINDGWFVIQTETSNNDWIDYPASYHNKAGGLSFADGHAEMKRWRDRAVLNTSTQPLRSDPTVPPVPPGYGDLRWLQARATVPK